VTGDVAGDGLTGDPVEDVSRDRAWPGAVGVHRLIHRAVGHVDPTAPEQRLWAQLETAASAADDTVIDLARRERTALVVSAAVYAGVATAVVSERAGVRRQWVNHSVQAAIGAGPRDPDFTRLADEARVGLEIPGAAELLVGSAHTVRFLTARAQAARPVRDRLIVLLSGRGVSTRELAARTGLSRAMVDRIRTTSTGPTSTGPGHAGASGSGAGGSGALGSGGGGSGGS
jgi:hypothetical protein